MKRIFTYVALVLSISSIAASPSESTHYYEVEYKKPAKGADNVSTLNLIYYVDVPKADAANMLKLQLLAAVAEFHPKEIIIADAWASRNGDESGLLDDTQSLVYDAKTGKISTQADYFSKQH